MKKTGFAIELTEKEVSFLKKWLRVESDAELRKVLEDITRIVVFAISRVRGINENKHKC